MPNTISKNRFVAFQEQSGRCYYCGSPMWLSNADEYAAKHAISRSAAARFQCTAEHLVARCDGGKNNKSNIVAACIFCNTNRHMRKKPPTPDSYKSHIAKQLRRGKWLPDSLLRVMGNSLRT
jgi:hypothetical protein